MKLVDDWGTQLLRPRKLSARLSCLMKYQQNDNKPFERMKKELAGLTPTIILAILHNTPLPDEVAVRALATIRSKMVQEEEEQKKWPVAESLAAAETPGQKRGGTSDAVLSS